MSAGATNYLKLLLTADSSQLQAEVKKAQGAVAGVVAGMDPLASGTRTATAQMDAMTMSAKQMSAAMRGVPAQISDIVVSLQGGMSPMTVFFQQGLQLRDMFNGFGAAGKALTKTVLGMVNPWTVAAAAAVAFGVAYYQGSQEVDAWTQAMVTSGNVVGVTTSELRSHAQALDGVVGTQAAAAQGLAVMVQAGVAGGQQLRDYTQAAMAWESATGTAVEDTATKFKSLAGDPLAAVLKLNEGTNFLTLSVYEEIKALQEQGQTAEAARVAQDAYAQSLAQGAEQIKSQLGTLERAWVGIKSAAAQAWDAMLNVGRPKTIDDQLAQVEKALEDAINGQSWGGTGGGAATGRVTSESRRQTEEAIEQLQQRKWVLMEQRDAEVMAAEAAKGRAQATAAASAWDQVVVSNLDKKAKLERELEQVRQKAAAHGVTGAALEEQLAAVREKYADKTKKANTAVNQAKTAYESLMVAINGKIEASRDELTVSGKQSEADKLRTRYKQELLTRAREFTASQRAQLEAEIQVLEAQERETAQQKRAIAQYAEEIKAQQKLLEQRQKNAEQVEDALKKAQDEEYAHIQAAATGKTVAEVLALTALARAEDNYQKEIALNADGQTLLALQREVEARRSLVEVMQQRGVREANEKAAKELAKDWEKTSQTVRDTLADYIMGGGRDAATYLKRLFSTLVLQPVVQYGVNAFMGAVGLGGDQQQKGFGNLQNLISVGKSAYEALTGQNTFLNQAMNFMGWGSGAAMSTASSTALAASAQNLSTAAAQMATGSAMDIASAEALKASAQSLSAGAAKSSSWMSTAWPLAIVAGMVASNKLYGAGYNANSRNGTGEALGIGNQLETNILGKIVGDKVANILTGAPVMSYTFELMGLTATPHTGAGAIYQNGALKEGAGIYNQANFGMGIADEYAASAQSAVSSLAAQAGNTLDAVANLFKLQSGYSVSTAFADDRSKDGAWGSLKIADALGNVLLDWEQSRQSRWAPREFSDGEAGYNEYLAAVQSDVLTAIQGMNLPAWAKDMFAAAQGAEGLQVALQSVAVVIATFDQLGKTLPMFADVADDVIASLLSGFGSLDGVLSAVDGFHQRYYSEEERVEAMAKQVQSALAGLSLDLDPRMGEQAKAQFRATVEAAVSSGQGELAKHLLSLEGSFATAADYAAQAAQSAAKSAEDAAKAAQDAAQEAYESAVEGAWANLEAAVGRERAYWDGIASTAQQAISSLSSTLGLLTSNARELYGTVDSAAQWQAAQGMVYIESALAAVRGGAGIAGFDGLSDAISAARNGISNGAYATQFDKDRDALVMAGQLSELGELTDAQLTVEERQLRAAQSQIDQLDQTLSYWQQQIDGTTSLIDATLSVPAAIQALAAALMPKTATTAGVNQAAAQAASGAALYADVADYGAQYGSDAYYFIPGVNDVASKLSGYQDLADMFGWSLDQAATHVSGHDTSYWNAVDAASKAGAVVNASDSLEEILRKAGVPGYAVGANYIPNRQLALLHEGEAVVPKAFNPWAGGTGFGGGNEELIAEIRALRAEVSELRAVNARTADNTQGLPQMVDQIDNVTEGGSVIRSREVA